VKMPNSGRKVFLAKLSPQHRRMLAVSINRVSLILVFSEDCVVLPANKLYTHSNVCVCVCCAKQDCAARQL
jgi:hypothetical protein